MVAHARSRGLAYQVDDFIDDQQRLLGESCESGQRDSCFSDLDGPIRVVHTRRLRTVLDGDDTPAAFHDKYGDAADRAFCRRCERVVRFLEKWRLEIVRSGLALSREDPLVVREEFLEFLLKYEPAPGQTAIPPDALTGFLDQWGHRWM